MAVFTAVALGAAPASAEPLLLFRSDSSPAHKPAAVRTEVKQQASVRLNGDGHLVVRYGDISLTAAYNPLYELFRPQEKVNYSQGGATHSTSVSIRMALLF